jgi:hypothetical protein
MMAMSAPDAEASVILCAQTTTLREPLAESLAACGFAVTPARTPEDVLLLLRESSHAALILEARRDSFSLTIRNAVRLRPAMPVHVIDGGAVFCFYPFAYQPRRLLKAIRAAGVAIAPGLMRHLGASPAVGSDAAFLV